MTWKRCNGCTRALSVTAFTCEYCGQLCDDVMDFLPGEERAPAALEAPAAAEFSLVAESPADDREDSEVPAARTLAVTHPSQAALPGVHADVAEFGLDEDPWSFTDEPAQPAGGESARVAAYGENSTFDRLRLDVDRFEAETSRQEVEAPAPAAAAATGGPAAAVPPKRLTPRQMAMAGAGVVAASALIFTSLSMRGSASPEPAPAVARPAAVKPAAPKPAAAVPTPAAAVFAADAPKWSRVNDGRWVGTSRHAAAFELPAVNRVHVWTRDVTPVLVVRCDRGAAEAFVFTQSAARMEPQDGDHTVRVAFDGGQERTERWPDSAEHDALFARHHEAFMQQLAQSSSLRFGFTPHNAGPVVATFAVDGLAELLAAHSRQCGWKQK